ncbi:hypothetical protein AB0O67_15905 [Streptomyces sp. NPDC086077]|uniref:hypothetical protein n=1 Tax=Streptomyces sp. NPDC086077 TaxID=3154862 RepID=UPI0034146E7B
MHPVHRDVDDQGSARCEAQRHAVLRGDDAAVHTGRRLPDARDVHGWHVRRRHHRRHRHDDHLEENVAAAELDLPPAHLARLDAMSAPG